MLIQQLVLVDAAAVVFSANPVTGSRDEVVINAGWGLGESIVRGTVTPDTYVIRKSDLAVVSRAIAEKRRMTVLASAGTHEVPVPRRQQRAPSIDDGQGVELARLGMALECSHGLASGYRVYLPRPSIVSAPVSAHYCSGCLLSKELRL